MRSFSIVIMLFLSMLLSQGALAEHLSGDIAVSSSSTTDINTTTEQYPPSNEAETKSEPSFTYTGCALLWVGWFGFNAGSELSADGVSALAFINTVLAPASGALVWSVCEKFISGHSSSLGSSSGVLAGLVAITPACAFVSPLASVIIGALSTLVCLWGVRGFKQLTRVDDSLDVFGIHGLGAIVGAILTGIFCSPDLGGTGFKGSHDGMVSQTLGQIGSVIITIIWSGVISVLAFGIAGKLFGSLHVSHDDERTGLDLSFHGERGYSN